MRFLKWELTHGCNLRCNHCLVGQELGPHTHDITTEDAYRVIDEASALGVKQMTLLGGEPFTRRDLVSIVGRCAKKSIDVSLVTNGLLLTRERFARLSDAGLAELTISIDGPNADTYDKVRGRGQFMKLYKALENTFDDYLPSGGKPRVCVNTVFEKGNSDENTLEEFLDLLSRYPISLWRLLALSNEGLTPTDFDFESRTLSSAESVEFGERLSIMIKRRQPTFELDPQFFAPLVWAYLQMRGFDLPWPQLCCDAASDMVFIDGKGFVSGCDRVRQLPNSSQMFAPSNNHVTSGPLKDLVVAPETLALYKHIAHFNAEPGYEPCNRCYYKASGRCEPCALFAHEEFREPYGPCAIVARRLEAQGISISEPLPLPDRPPRREPILHHSSAPIDAACVPKRNQELQCVVDGDSCFIFHGLTNQHFRLSGVPAVAFLLVDDQRTAADIVQIARTAAGGASLGEEEVCGWLASFREKGLIATATLA
jgi:MoaA/NifB/PqqE/SkfB family radical SAM enzyme